MSTKTLRKRIALVAVSALGFGLVSVAPASAAGRANTGVTIGSPIVTVAIGGTATTNVSVALSTALAADQGDTTTITVAQTSIPALSANTLADNDGSAGSGADIAAISDSATTGLTTAARTNAAILITGDAAGGTATTVAAGTISAAKLTIKPDVPGRYVYTVNGTAADGTTAAGTAQTWTVIALPTTSTTTALTATADRAAYSAANQDPVITVSRNTGAAGQSDGAILAMVSATSDSAATGTVGTVLGYSGYSADASGANVTIANSSGNTTFTFDVASTAAATAIGAGTYSYTFWNDTNSDGLMSTGEPSTTATFTVGAAATTTTAITATLSRTIASTATGVNQVTVTATVVDALGQPTTASLSVAETDSLGASVSGLTSAASNNSLAGFTTASPTNGTSGNAMTRVGTTNTYTATFTVDAAPTTLDYVDTYLTVYIDGTIAATATTSAKKALRIANTADLTAVAGAPTIALTDAAGIGTVTAGVKQTLTGDAAADIAVTVDRTVLTHTYTFNAAVGNEGEYLLVSVTPAAATSSTVVAPVTTLVAVGADLQAKYSVTAVAPAAADGYTLTVTGGTSDSSVVTFATAAPAWSVSPSASFKAKFGDTSTVTGTLADQFGRIQAAKAVYVSVTGRQAGTYNGTTAADGTLAFTWKDTNAATTVTLTDVLTFNYPYFASATSTTTTLATSASRTVTYSATGVAVGSISVAAPSATTTRPIDVDAPVGVPGATARVVYTASVKDAAGLPVASGALVTFTGGADDLFLGGSTGVTDEFGQASVTVYRTKVGAPAIKATAGGVTSAASAAVQWTNDVANATAASAPIASTAYRQARYITLAADVASVVSAGIIRFTAKVTDRWGNAIAGAQVTFAETGAGRFYNPPTSNQVTTNAAGEASIDLNSQAGETGAVSVTATITSANSVQAISEDAAGFVTHLVHSGTATDAAGTFTGTLTAVAGVTAAVKSATATSTITKDTSTSTADALLALAQALGTRDQASATVDAAAEATDAANAATDAANAAAEAADAATAAAQDASDAVAALSAQVSEAIAGLKKQLVSLTNLVIKIQKKVKA